MLRARMAASVLAATIAAGLPAAPVFAAANSADGRAAARALAGADPCAKKKEKEDACQQLPEAPNPLVYPLAGSAALILFVALERRRRQRRGHTQA